MGGLVQGVSFRWWVRARAAELSLTGWATNLDDGRVVIVVEGARPACQALLDLLDSPAPPGRVRTVTAEWGVAAGLTGFAVRSG